jgi:CheY-like chemotaxis protein
MDGQRCCSALRAAGWAGAIVAATGNASAADRERYLQNGFDAVLVKPFGAAALQTAVEEAVARRGGAGSRPP